MGWLGIPKLIQNVFQSKTDVFRKEVIIPHRMKLDLSLNTDVFARGEEFKDTLLMLAEVSLLLFMLQRQLFSTRCSSVVRVNATRAMIPEATNCYFLGKANERLVR